MPPCRQIAPNTAHMLQQLALNYKAGQVLWAYSLLMLLALLKDPQVLQQPPSYTFTIAAAGAATGMLRPVDASLSAYRGLFVSSFGHIAPVHTDK